MIVVINNSENIVNFVSLDDTLLPRLPLLMGLFQLEISDYHHYCHYYHFHHNSLSLSFSLSLTYELCIKKERDFLSSAIPLADSYSLFDRVLESPPLQKLQTQLGWERVKITIYDHLGRALDSLELWEWPPVLRFKTLNWKINFVCQKVRFREDETGSEKDVSVRGSKQNEKGVVRENWLMK